jgi:hypothetical protein
MVRAQLPPGVGLTVNWQRRDLKCTELTVVQTLHPRDQVQCSARIAHHHSLPTMNYGKKDEDAETGVLKVDRTQVFQEGELPASLFPTTDRPFRLIYSAWLPRTANDC